MARTRSTFPQIRLFLLGPLRIERDGKPVSIRRRKAQLLLAYLTQDRAPHSREKIAALFWGDSTDAQARLSLRVTLAALRQALHPDLIVADGATIELHPEMQLWVDTAELERVAHRIQQLPVHGESLAVADALHALESLYRGEFLAGEYEDWILSERERYRSLYVELLLHLTGLFRSAGDYTRAVATAQKVLAQDRANEHAHQHLIVCYATLGDRTSALEQYEIATRALRNDLGVEPSAETRLLVERISQQPVSASPAARFTNLPQPLTSFVGRENELEQLQAILLPAPTWSGGLSTQSSVLVTLLGPGGSGKTRLAIELGRILVDEYTDGVWWVELAYLGGDSLVAQALAKTIGVREEPDATIEQSLADVLSKRSSLIILDNCEHLLHECARLVQVLAPTCPNIRWLATSRTPLSIAGEQVYRVPKLAVPAPDPAIQPAALTLIEYPAVRLFIERAGDSPASFTLTDQNAVFVAQICRRLDGIPLALEIAAARLQEMPAQELAAHLDERFEWLSGAGTDAPGRHQTLRALFDWSFELLTPPERAMFRRLAVFRGGVDLQGAVSVAYGDIDANLSLDELGTTPSAIVLQLLTQLADKSLLSRQHALQGIRYEMLETIREYAHDKLSELGEEDVIRKRHLAHFDALVSMASDKLFGPDQVRWLDQLEREHPNLRAALQFAAISKARETHVRMTANLGTFWQLRNYWSEGREWLRQAVELAGDGAPSTPLAKAYGTLGVLAWLQGDYVRALARHRKALELYRRIEEPWGIANALNNVALQLQALGAYAEARLLYYEALALARELEHPRLVLRVLNNLCSTAYLQGELETAEAFSQEALAQARALGDKYALAIALINCAQVTIARNSLEEALTFADEALTVARELGNQEFIAEAVRHKAMAYLKHGDVEQARVHFRDSLQIAFGLGAKRQITWSLEGLALVAAADAQWVHAVRHLAAASALRKRIAIPRDAAERAEQDALRERLSAELGTERFDQEWQVGEHLDLETAVEAALNP